MNERIKELAGQAYLHALGKETKAREDGNFEYDSFTEDFREKFVELLLKECMDVALYGDEFEQAKANIKQHFGVEE